MCMDLICLAHDSSDLLWMRWCTIKFRIRQWISWLISQLLPAQEGNIPPSQGETLLLSYVKLVIFFGEGDLKTFHNRSNVIDFKKTCNSF